MGLRAPDVTFNCFIRKLKAIFVHHGLRHWRQLTVILGALEIALYTYVCSIPLYFYSSYVHVSFSQYSHMFIARKSRIFNTAPVFDAFGHDVKKTRMACPPMMYIV